MKCIVKSTVIDWQEKTMEVKTVDGEAHTIPLDTTITVTMVGYPDREQKTMLARELGEYMGKGYTIEQIEHEESR